MNWTTYQTVEVDDEEFELAVEVSDDGDIVRIEVCVGGWPDGCWVPMPDSMLALLDRGELAEQALADLDACMRGWP